MDILKQCSFIDRHRNSDIELIDLIEEKYLNGRRIHKENVTHLMLYFNAKWLPSSCNEMLNLKLEKFMKHKNNFELIFVSMDKTRDLYEQFLKENKFIRYSLSFHDNELKVLLLLLLLLIFVCSIPKALLQ